MMMIYLQNQGDKYKWYVLDIIPVDMVVEPGKTKELEPTFFSSSSLWVSGSSKHLIEE